MPITFEKILSNLPLVAENIMIEAAQHPGKFLLAGRYRVQCMRAKNVAKAKLEGRRTLIGMRVRAKASNRGDRATDKAVAERVEQAASVKILRARYDRAEEAETLAIAALSAYFHRQQSIRIIADQQNLEGVRDSRETDRMEQTNKLRRKAEELSQTRGRRRLTRSDEEDED